jgi:acetyl esterase
MTLSYDVLNTQRLENDVFKPEWVPAATSAVTAQLRRDGASAPPLTRAHVEELQSSPPTPAGPLAVEPPSDLAVDRVIDGPGGALRLRVLRPETARACYLHIHGGGWALGGADRQDQTLMRFATVGRVVVIAVDYRLAPAHPHPAGVVDCVAAIRWVAANGERELGASRLIVGGESAGAHLAALALLVLRDCDELQTVTAANLAYGVYDVSMTPSARRWGDQRIVINTPDLAFFAAQYAPPERHRDPDVSPLYADLTGLPPALFSCGTLDPLLDDTLFMAARWQAAVSPALQAIYAGAPHEFLNLRARIPAASQARARMVRFVDRVLAGAAFVT